ncbi:hypothetical protein NIES2104_55770 [Leptolyngbya sp. NIES-2104]|nr:hypothetical protein NIES2104_55770 [Leptolyngbya sp. NIES-2104]
MRSHLVYKFEQSAPSDDLGVARSRDKIGCFVVFYLNLKRIA